MGTAIFMVLMVCGYWYTSRDLSTRFKIKRSFGWDVYFLVALYGSIFVLQGVIATGLLWLLLLALSAANNAFHSTALTGQAAPGWTARAGKSSTNGLRRRAGSNNCSISVWSKASWRRSRCGRGGYTWG